MSTQHICINVLFVVLSFFYDTCYLSEGLLIKKDLDLDSWIDLGSKLCISLNHSFFGQHLLFLSSNLFESYESSQRHVRRPCRDELCFQSLWFLYLWGLARWEWLTPSSPTLPGQLLWMRQDHYWSAISNEWVWIVIGMCRLVRPPSPVPLPAEELSRFLKAMLLCIQDWYWPLTDRHVRDRKLVYLGETHGEPAVVGLHTAVLDTLVTQVQESQPQKFLQKHH